MFAEGFDLSILMALTILIALLSLYGPFGLLFFLPVPFYIVSIIFVRKFLYKRRIFVPILISRISFIRGPPLTQFSE
jgi:hypothetical protein